MARHAEATAVGITLSQENGQLLLEVSDNGKGITEQQISAPRALGLIGMRERARFLGGAFRLIGTPGKGTTVTVRIPFDGEADR